MKNLKPLKLMKYVPAARFPPAYHLEPPLIAVMPKNLTKFFCSDRIRNYQSIHNLIEIFNLLSLFSLWEISLSSSASSAFKLLHRFIIKVNKWKIAVGLPPAEETYIIFLLELLFIVVHAIFETSTIRTS